MNIGEPGLPSTLHLFALTLAASAAQFDNHMHQFRAGREGNDVPLNHPSVDQHLCDTLAEAVRILHVDGIEFAAEFSCDFVARPTLGDAGINDQPDRTGGNTQDEF